MTKQNYHHIEMLYDRTGSMSEIKSDAEGGMHAFIEQQQRNVVGDRRITLGLRQFDWDYGVGANSFDVVQKPTDISESVSPTIEPRGNTPLYDAIGWAVTETGAWLSGMKEKDRPERVFFVIVTDGLENYSQEWTQQMVFDLRKRQEEEFNWDFVYLAAGQDAMVEGSKIGIRAGSTTTYRPTPNSTRAAYASASLGLTNAMGSGARVENAYSDVSDEETAKQVLRESGFSEQ